MKRFVFLLFFSFYCLLNIGVISKNNSVVEDPEELIRKAEEITFTNPEQSVYYATKAFQILSEDDDLDKNNELKLQAMIAYSFAERLLGNFDSSIKMLYDALKLSTPSNSNLKGKIYSLMGVLYCSLGDYNQSINYNDKATAIFKSLGDSALIASSLNNRGVIHYNLDEFKIAEQFFLRALAINRSLKLMKEAAGNLNNLSLYKGDTEQKLDFINEAIVINKNLNAQWSLGENYNNLGKQYFYAQQYPDALKALNKAYEVATTIGAKELICDNYEYSAWVYSAMGNYKEAYEALDKLYLLSNELQKASKLRAIEQDISNKRFQLQQRESEITEHNYKIELLKRNIFILLVVISLIISIVLFFSKWYKKRKQIELMNAQYMLEQSEHKVAQLKVDQQKLELENAQNSLESKRKEITAFALYLQSRNELLDKIKEMIQRGYRMKSDDLVLHLKKINLFIAQNQSAERDNNSLLMSIEEKNQEFLQRLVEHHPNLTPGEKDLALLLCINLSTKEISLITGKNPKSINMNRYRLRKSLNLSSETNINEYLQSI